MKTPTCLSRRTSLAVGLAAPAVATLAHLPAHAQQEAMPPLRIVVPYPPGGGSDRISRLIADSLRKKLNTTVTVENITGAGGRVALQQIKAMAADTNIIAICNPALMVVAPLVFKNIGYDPATDFQAVSEVATYDLAIAVASAVPVREFNHLNAWLRVNPDKANIGVPATGSLPHFFALMVAQSAKAKVQVVGYRGSAPLVTDLIGGHLPAAIDGFDSLEAQHRGGKVKILATSGSKRLLPEVPTFQEAGLNLVAKGWNTMFAKSTMPAARVRQISDAIASVMTEATIREQVLAQKTDPVSANLQQTQASLKAFKAQWEPVIRGADLKLD